MTMNLILCRNNFVFALFSICLLLNMGVATGSILDVHVYDEGKPASEANVYIDHDIFLGKTNSEGLLTDISISPGMHMVVAKWRDSNDNKRIGSVSFEAEYNTLIIKRIDLKRDTTGNLGWIWQFVKDLNG